MLYEFLNNIAIIACSSRSSLKLAFLPQAILFSRQRYFLEFQCSSGSASAEISSNPISKSKMEVSGCMANENASPLWKNNQLVALCLCTLTSELWPSNQERYCFQTKVAHFPQSIYSTYLH